MMLNKEETVRYQFREKLVRRPESRLKERGVSQITIAKQFNINIAEATNGTCLCHTT